MYPKIEIKRGDSNGGKQVTQIYVDGHKLSGVRSFSLEQRACNEIPIMTIELNALDLSIDSPVTLVHEHLGEIESISFKETIINDVLDRKAEQCLFT